MNAAQLLDGFRGLRAVVIGDLMLDEYIHGHATRISPEAPVIVVRQSRVEAVPGGAANVAHNMAALGAIPTLVGVVGDDAGGRQLAASLTEGGTATHLVIDPSRPTTRKTRILADQAHQILRIDHEDDRQVMGDTEASLVEAITRAVQGTDVVVVSDYLKGALTPAVVDAIRAACGSIPMIVNAKPKSARQYHGATLVQMNRAEVTLALGLDSLPDSDASAKAIEMRKAIDCHHVLVTLGGSGMAAASSSQTLAVAAPRVAVFDTAGAGDTVIATVALGMATAGFRSEVFELAAAASAAVVRKVGVAVPSIEDLSAIRTGQPEA
ncbi:MAG: bifunctional heptose 7-phosphate kinase/heptose 1-phosphate adenyltransferase [Fimbriimonas sp.]